MKRKVSFIRKGKRVSRDCKHISNNFYRYNYYGKDYIYDDNDRIHYAVVMGKSFSHSGICNKCKKETRIPYLPVRKLSRRRVPSKEITTIKMPACHMKNTEIGNMTFMNEGYLEDYIYNDLPEMRNMK